ncbi:MAG: class I SAM-dependent methyltransferase [Chloroflexi bacterium]|nr:class I SAM-dependent methyltransferase [Chloroflexota bacterium]
MAEQPEVSEPVSSGGAVEPNWDEYYRRTLGREPRPLFRRGIAAATAAGVVPGQAVEIGFGDVTETLTLLDAGWRVLAVDPTPAAAEGLRSRVRPSHAERLEIQAAPAQDSSLVPFDLLYAGYALSFLDRDGFRRFWLTVRDRLRPGGFVVVNIFGVRDTWAGASDMTFVDREEVDRLLEGLEVVEILEEDADGDSFSGPKHWHVFDVIARRPGANS